MERRSTVLLVDDEESVQKLLTYPLEREGYEVVQARDGEEALERYRETPVDLVILDLMLPKLDGLAVCRRLREERSAVPIIMLTARDAELDQVLGLEIGADDYVTKPFSMAELMGRIRAILRRRELDRSGSGGKLQVGSLELDPTRHEAGVDGQPKRLTPSEFKLLLLLAEQPERVYSRREIMQHLWDSEYVGDQRACDIHISNLRQKLERDPAHPERILTVRGVGYKLAAV
jgi:DNA-binding response OmpR family regulator